MSEHWFSSWDMGLELIKGTENSVLKMDELIATTGNIQQSLIRLWRVFGGQGERRATKCSIRLTSQLIQLNDFLINEKSASFSTLWK